jgi:peptidoglycan endopeptidase LytF
MALRGVFILTLAVFGFSFSSVAQTRELPRYLQHTVRERETPSSIANDYNLSLKTFLLRNDFPDNVKLRPGQVVIIRELEPWEKQVKEKGYVSKSDDDEPAPAKKTETHTVKSEKTRTVEKTETTTTSEKPAHAAPAVTGSLYEKSGGNTHIVQRGQTFYRIALTYGLTVDQLKKLNGMSNTNIAVGQELKIK